MVKSLIGSAVAVLGLLIAAPTRAEVERPQGLVSGVELQEPGSAGYRVQERPGGFELVEHGLWNSPDQRSFEPAAEAVLRSSPSSTKKGSRTRVPTSFRRAAFLQHVLAAEAQFSLPAGLLDALVWTESRYNPVAVSKAGAVGLGQLMPGTASDLGVTNRFDPKENLMGAARYLRRMLDRFGAVHLALAAYNAGPGAVERSDGIPRNGETPGYVREVLRHWRY